MEDIIDIETNLSNKLQELHKRLEKSASKDVSGDLHKVLEVIKANTQRSKVFSDQVNEAKESATLIFEHKPMVIDIINKTMQMERERSKLFLDSMIRQVSSFGYSVLLDDPDSKLDETNTN